MIVTSLASYFINEGHQQGLYGGKKDFDWEQPLTHLVWLTSASFPSSSPSSPANCCWATW
jgi:hypothetical protein